MRNSFTELMAMACFMITFAFWRKYNDLNEKGNYRFLFQELKVCSINLMDCIAIYWVKRRKNRSKNANSILWDNHICPCTINPMLTTFWIVIQVHEQRAQIVIYAHYFSSTYASCSSWGKKKWCGITSKCSWLLNMTHESNQILTLTTRNRQWSKRIVREFLGTYNLTLTCHW
jgi:hypothetical protein